MKDFPVPGGPCTRQIRGIGKGLCTAFAAVEMTFSCDSLYSCKLNIKSNEIRSLNKGSETNKQKLTASTFNTFGISPIKPTFYANKERYSPFTDLQSVDSCTTQTMAYLKLPLRAFRAIVLSKVFYGLHINGASEADLNIVQSFLKRYYKKHYTSAVYRKQRGQVVSASDSQSSGPGFEFRSDLYLDLFHGGTESKSSATLVNSQLVCLRSVGIFNNVALCLMWIICFSCLLAPTSLCVKTLPRVNKGY